MPDKSTVVSFSCYVKNAYADETGPKIKLIHRTLDGQNDDTLFEGENTTKMETPQNISDTSIDDSAHAVIDNSQYSYLIFYNPPDNTDVADTDQVLYGCTIS